MSDSIESPATAKNVISVGSIESQRNIPSNTNFPTAFPESDSDSQVADFSSRGNVGIGLEGDNGRFKPDLVTPGTWILSLSASNYPATNRTIVDQTIGKTQLRYESGTSMSAPVVSGMLALMQEFFTTNLAVTNSPALNKALLINGARPASADYDYAVNNQINYQGWGVPLLSNSIPADFKFLTNAQGSAQAQVVAVDQGVFGTTNRLETGEVNTYQLTVDGGAKDFPVRITLAWTDPPGNPASSMQLVNDLDIVVSNQNNGEVFIGNNITSGNDFNDVGQPNPTNASVVVEHDFVNNIENVFIPGPFTNSGGGAVNLTIQIKGKRVNVNAVGYSTNAVEQDYALVVSTVQGQQITLQHQGNLDYVTNRVATGLLNGIPLTEELVGANHPFLFNGDGTNNAYGSTNQWNFYVFTNTDVGPITNSSTNITGSITNSSTNVVTPLTNAGQYVAFVTFFPPNASRARNDEADIDIYVTRQDQNPLPNQASDLTNLAPGVLWHANTKRSTNRGGIEVIAFDDARVGEIFYVGVKSEDQQGGRYGFLAVSRSEEFARRDSSNRVEWAFIPSPVSIPDGSPSSPGGVQMFGICTISTNIMSPYFTNTVAHENFGDLSISLTHNARTMHLWNHNNSFAGSVFDHPPSTNYTGQQTRYFDANAYGVAAASRMPDGPGTLDDFFEEDALGLWILNVTDDALNHTGLVERAGMIIGDRQNRSRQTNGNNVEITFDIDPGESFVDVVYVPFTVTNMLVSVVGAPNSDPGIDLLLGYNQVPQAAFFTNAYFTNVNGTNYAVTNRTADTNIYKLLAPTTSAGSIQVNHNTTPRPLTVGPWFARVINNTSTKHTLTLKFVLEHNMAIGGFFGYESLLDHDLVDNGATNFLISVPDWRTIVDLDVGVGIDHPRPSDLVIHLIAPSGKKALLFENRGATNRRICTPTSVSTRISTQR